jgi:hypothetical protein
MKTIIVDPDNENWKKFIAISEALKEKHRRHFEENKDRIIADLAYIKSMGWKAGYRQADGTIIEKKISK